MYDDVSRRFVVELTAITTTIQPLTGAFTSPTNTDLMQKTISLAIDSTVPYLYLPQEICALFEEAFGLVWVSSSNRYIANLTAQPALQKLNPNITFTLANPQGETLNITFPYSAFNITIQPNKTNPDTILSFPLKRAFNDTQYTLGRTFLQESYVNTYPNTFYPLNKTNQLSDSRLSTLHLHNSALLMAFYPKARHQIYPPTTPIPTTKFHRLKR